MDEAIRILWADDEIDLLKPQILFLEEKGYAITPVTNGQDAIDKCVNEYYDIVFLDESMPGLSGLETLDLIKASKPEIPVIMITKNEEENLMDEALGSKITDYLIKPVKPNQILLSIKKIIDNKRLVSEKTTSAYQQDFQQLFARFSEDLNYEQWADVYKKLVYWELELSNSKEGDMSEVLNMQKEEANREFSKFISSNYIDWMRDRASGPTFTDKVMAEKVFPLLSKDTPVFFILIDNLRLDQWRVLQPAISESFRLIQEETLYSILPTATQYSRNAIFSGLMPAEIERQHPDLWLNDADEGGKNMYEAELLEAQLRRTGTNAKFSYTKITNHKAGKELEDNVLNLMHNDLNVIVYNFVDMLSHARTEMEVLKELANDEAAYRSLTASWFDHSPLHNALRKLAGKDITIVVTSDHGTIRVKNPVKVQGDRETTSNLRYKSGKNLKYERKDVFEVPDPAMVGLPKPNVSSRFIFTRENDYFVYPNNYHHFANYFKDTFQHGGISLEEVIIPFAVFS